MVRLALFLALAIPLASGGWDSFKSPDCPLTVDFPGEVRAVAESAWDEPSAPVLYSYSAHLDSTSSLAACSQLPPSVYHLPSVEARLDAAALRGVGGSDLESFERLTVGGHPARRWAEVLDFGEGLMVTHRLMVYSKTHQYQLATGMYTSADDVERFFGSLELR